MKQIFFILLLLSSRAFAVEQDPVAKAKLAVKEGEIVLGLAEIDTMCLRLGRFSAILKRIAGSVPEPPIETTRHYRNYESFCGWDSIPISPRGNLETLRANLKTDMGSLESYISNNSKETL